MSDNRKISEEYTEIGNVLIQMMPELKELKESDVQIIFLASEDEKKKAGKLIFGQCEKVSNFLYPKSAPPVVLNSDTQKAGALPL